MSNKSDTDIVTPEALFRERRTWLKQAALGISALSLNTQALDFEKAQRTYTVDEPSNSYKDITDLNPHRKKEITHFFQVYKDLEKKKVDVGGWGNAAEAREIYKKCVERYQNSEHKKNRNFTI